MIVRTLEVGLLRTNCYVVAPEEGGDAVVIDPGGGADAILATLQELGATARLILLTHYHFDHVLAVPELQDVTGAPLAIHAAEAGLLARPPTLFRFVGFAAPALRADRLLHDGEDVDLGRIVLRVLHTPGHSPGGASFYLASDGAVFSGDALFRDGVGRTDFPGSSGALLARSIRERLFTLPDETIVCPGHGPATTIGRERRGNPWLSEE